MIDESFNESGDSQFSVLNRTSISLKSNSFMNEKDKEKTVASIKTELVEEQSNSDSEYSSDDCSEKPNSSPKEENNDSSTKQSTDRPAFLRYESNSVKSKNTFHSLSDEEIKDVPRTSLSNESFTINLSTVKNNSFAYEDSESSNQACTDSYSSNTKSKRSSVGTSTSKDESWLKLLKKKMTPVQHLVDADYSKALHLEEISNDEDIFLIQCPKEIDPKSLRKNEIILNDVSSVSVKIDGHSSRYDSFIVKCESERQLDLLLHSKENSKLQLGRFPLSGYLILSQSVDVPLLTKPVLSPVKKVQYPEKLEKLCLSLPVADSPSDSSNFCTVSELKKKRKKKIKQEKNISCSSDSGIESPRKKQTLEDSRLEMESFNVSTIDASLSDIKKKKKKKKIKEELIESEDFQIMPPPSEIPLGNHKKRSSDEYIKPEDSEIILPPLTTALENHKKRRRSSGSPIENHFKSSEYSRTEDVTNTHKKRKKKHRDSDSTALENSLEGITIKIEPTDSFNEEDNQLVKKKKKKKSTDCDSPAPENYFDVIKIKTEPLDSFDERDYVLETKKKKKKRKTEVYS